MNKKKSSIILAIIIVVCAMSRYEGDSLKKIFDNIVFDISASTVKNYYSVYGYMASLSEDSSRPDSPVSLALRYGNEVGIETLPKPDGTDYNEDNEENEETSSNDGNDESENESETAEAKMASAQSQTETVQEQESSTQEVSQQVNTIAPETLSFEYLMKNVYTAASTTVVYESDINGPEFMARDMSMKQDNTKPQILIYHTHGQEGFTDSVEGDPGTKIIGVGRYLTDLLRENYGYNIIHLEDSFDLVDGVLDRSKAYDYAYNRISQVLADNPSVEVVIDLHRDGVNENMHPVTEINGKPTAQIMFFNGMSRLASTGDIDYLYNPNRSDNLAFSLQLKIKAMEYYPEFTRRNYLQAYEYNQQVRPKALLIEAGAQTNSLEEEKNAMEPLSELLHMVLS